MALARLPPEDRPELQGLSVNFPLLVAGSLALLGAGIHGVAGEALVVRRLSPGGLPSSPFGGPGMTKAMIRAAWHMTTVAFLTVGSALVLSGSVLHGDTARGIGLVAAGESTGFAALAVGSAFKPREPCSATPLPPCSPPSRRWLAPHDPALQRREALPTTRASRSPRKSPHPNRVDGGRRMRLPNTAHTSRPWRIHELTHDFRLEDVWALPTPGGPDDFPRLVHLIASSDPLQGSSRPARMLSAIRWKLGELLGWDDADAGLGSRVPTLRDRLPVDLRDAPSGPEFAALPFTSLYLLDDEWAAEIANRTMHGVMHIGWVPDPTAGYRAQMAVLVKPNGLFGAAYMAAIRPFRYLIVYPQIMRAVRRKWRAGARSASWPGAPA